MNCKYTHPLLVAAAIAVLTIGCGDPGQGLDPDPQPDPEREGTDGSSDDEVLDDGSLDVEVQLACESFCDSMHECAGVLVDSTCVASCISLQDLMSDGTLDCRRAQIDLLNCYTGVSCEAVRGDTTACMDAEWTESDACDGRFDRELEIGDPEEVGELAGRTFVDRDAEEVSTESGEESVTVEVPGAVHQGGPGVVE